VTLAATPVRTRIDVSRQICLVAARAGSRFREDALYLDNVRWVSRLTYSRVGNRSDAENLTADVFMAVLASGVAAWA
jgi:DNA-directed RNA polymerase specialized sigma24 family protein